jgi:ribose transport system ATP-binding protein
MQSGEIYIDGKEVKIHSPGDAIREGLALIPEDRKKHGILLDMTIKENISFITIKTICHSCVINNKADEALSLDYIEKFSIKTPSMDQTAKNLSGGNQQKVVLAKSLAGSSKIIIFDEPTRGIDVGAKQEIYALMNQLVQQGMAIIMISSEMPELLGMADRIVMHEGSVTGEVLAKEASQNIILELASGNM